MLNRSIFLRDDMMLVRAYSFLLLFRDYELFLSERKLEEILSEREQEWQKVFYKLSDVSTSLNFIDAWITIQIFFFRRGKKKFSNSR